MPGERALEPAETPESPQKSRLEQALDLITDEAVETLTRGRNPRAYQRTEKLLAIARAIRLECAQSVEDFLVEGHGDVQRGVGQNFVWGGDNNVVMDPVQFDGAVGPYRGQGAYGDMQREEKLAQLEALTSRSRRDEAEARLALIREFRELSDLDLSKHPHEIRKSLEARLLEITEKLRPAESTEPMEDPEPEEKSA